MGTTSRPISGLSKARGLRASKCSIIGPSATPFRLGIRTRLTEVYERARGYLFDLAKVAVLPTSPHGEFAGSPFLSLISSTLPLRWYFFFLDSFLLGVFNSLGLSVSGPIVATNTQVAIIFAIAHSRFRFIHQSPIE